MAEFIGLAKRILVQEDGCWIWTGARLANGYGVVKHEKRNQVVHRVVYNMLVGPVPAGLELDHLCNVKGCCNPAHLEPVTHFENVWRGIEYRAKKDAA